MSLRATSLRQTRTTRSSPVISSALASSLAVLALFCSPAVAADPFVDKTLIEEGKRLDLVIKTAAAATKKTARELRLDAEKALAGPAADARAASALFMQATVVDPQDADLWLGLSGALLAIRSDAAAATSAATPADRQIIPAHAASAAYRGYEKAKTTAQKGRALALVADAYRRRSLWRASLSAYAASLGHADVPTVRAAYTQVRTEHGFRIIDTRADTGRGHPARLRGVLGAPGGRPDRLGVVREARWPRCRRGCQRAGSSASTASRTAATTRSTCAPACRR